MTHYAPASLPTPPEATSPLPHAPLLFSDPIRAALLEWGATRSGWDVTISKDDEGDEWATVIDDEGNGRVIVMAGSKCTLKDARFRAFGVATTSREVTAALRGHLKQFNKEADARPLRLAVYRRARLGRS